jgi:hypothetical protein
MMPLTRPAFAQPLQRPREDSLVCVSPSIKRGGREIVE